MENGSLMRAKLILPDIINEIYLLVHPFFDTSYNEIDSLTFANIWADSLVRASTNPNLFAIVTFPDISNYDKKRFFPKEKLSTQARKSLKNNVHIQMANPSHFPAWVKNEDIYQRLDRENVIVSARGIYDSRCVSSTLESFCAQNDISKQRGFIILDESIPAVSYDDNQRKNGLPNVHEIREAWGRQVSLPVMRQYYHDRYK